MTNKVNSPRRGLRVDLFIKRKLGHIEVDVIRGSAALIFANIVVRVLGFFFPIVLAWLFIPSDFGFFRYVLTVGQLLGQVVTAGIPNALTQRLAANKGDLDAHIKYSTNALFAVSILFLFVISIIYGIIPQDSHTRLMTVVIIGGLVIDSLFYSILRGFLRYTEMALYRIAANSLQLLILGFIFWMDLVSPELVIIIYGYVYILPIAGICLLTTLKHGSINWGHFLARNVKISVVVLRDLLTFSFPLILSAFAYGIISGIDVVFIEKWEGLESVGIYSAIKNLTTVFVFVPFGITSILMPKVASLINPAQIKSHVYYGIVVTAIASAGLLVFITLFGTSIAQFILPSEYQYHLELLHILSWAMGLFSLYTVLSQTWIGLGKPVVPAAVLSIAAASNVLWNFFSIRYLSIAGPAWGVVVAYTIGVLLLGSMTILKFDDLLATQSRPVS